MAIQMAVNTLRKFPSISKSLTHCYNFIIMSDTENIVILIVCKCLKDLHESPLFSLWRTNHSNIISYKTIIINENTP